MPATATKKLPKCTRCDGDVRLVHDAFDKENYYQCMTCGHSLEGVETESAETGSAAEPIPAVIRERNIGCATKTTPSPPAKPPAFPSAGRIATYSTDQISQLIIDLRWPDGPRCTRCRSSNVVGVVSKKPQPLRCRSCQHYFSGRQDSFIARTLNNAKWMQLIASTIERRRVPEVEQILRITPASTKVAIEKCRAILLDAVRRSGVKLSKDSPESIACKLLNLPPAAEPVTEAPSREATAAPKTMAQEAGERSDTVEPVVDNQAPAEPTGTDEIGITSQQPEPAVSESEEHMTETPEPADVATDPVRPTEPNAPAIEKRPEDDTTRRPQHPDGAVPQNVSATNGDLADLLFRILDRLDDDTLRAIQGETQAILRECQTIHNDCASSRVVAEPEVEKPPRRILSRGVQ